MLVGMIGLVYLHGAEVLWLILQNLWLSADKSRFGKGLGHNIGKFEWIVSINLTNIEHAIELIMLVDTW